MDTTTLILVILGILVLLAILISITRGQKPKPVEPTINVPPVTVDVRAPGGRPGGVGGYGSGRYNSGNSWSGRYGGGYNRYNYGGNYNYGGGYAGYNRYNSVNFLPAFYYNRPFTYTQPTTYAYDYTQLPTGQWCYDANYNLIQCNANTTYYVPYRDVSSDQKSPETTSISIILNVVEKDSTHPYYKQGSNLGYAVDGVQGKTLNLKRNTKYQFIVKGMPTVAPTDKSGHPVYLSNDPAGTGKEPIANTPAPDYTIDIIFDDSFPSSFYYDCGNHPYMGGLIQLS